MTITIIISCLQVRTNRKDVTAIASVIAPFISIVAAILFLDLALFVLLSTAVLSEPLEIFSESPLHFFSWELISYYAECNRKH
jgi:hypothetical protein